MLFFCFLNEKRLAVQLTCSMWIFCVCMYTNIHS